MSNHRRLLLPLLAVLAFGALACARGRGAKTQDGGGDVSKPGSDAGADRATADAIAHDAGGTLDTSTGADGTVPDTGPTVTGDIESGQPCLTGAECKSGYCVDSVCCQTACTDKCTACAEAYTGGDNGICAPARAGMDPRDSCTAAAPETCGDDGTCDGLGACRKFGSNQLCVAATCAGTTFNPTRTCDGLGACAPSTPTECGAYPCTTVGCAKPCAADAECGAQSYCAAGQCKAKKSNGDACGAANECTSAFCVDGTCCQTACTGACVSCAEADTNQKSGTCQPVAAGKDPADDCATEPTAMCGRDGTCDGKGACRKYDAATKCSDAVCAGTMFTPARTCANGACAAATAVNCQQAACTTAGCQTGCTKDADCATGAYCAGTSCAARKSNGDVCATGNECTSKACVDGVCCDTACAGLCYACTIAMTGQASGKCAPVSAGTDVDSECTATAKSTCGTEGTCDGAGACKRWGQGTECAAGMCNAAGNFVSARTCDGLGTCGVATTDTCSPNVCAATGCVRTCTKNTDCVGATYCAADGKCTSKKTQGATCGAAAECSSDFCVDGVCCNNACNGVCVSCRAAQNGQPADGTCANVTTGTDPASECAAGTTTCGLDGFCGGGRCRFAPATTSCAAASCSNATLTAARSCDGSGACPSTTSSTPCPGNVICASATACKSSTCAADADCISGYYCSAGTCRAKGAVGAACSGSSSGNQCLSNSCSSDQICCSSACAAACQGCNVANTGVATGTCAVRPSTSQCNGACAAGYVKCGTRCVSLTWNFDQGYPPNSNTRTPYGWYSDDMNGVTEADIFYLLTSHTTGSNHGSLSIDNVGESSRLVSTTPCTDPNDPATTLPMDLRGKTATVWFYRTTAAPEPSNCGFIFNWVATAPQFFGASIQLPAGAGTWIKLTGVLPKDGEPNADAAANVHKIGFTCQMPDGWSGGRLLFDEVSIGP